MANFVYKHTEVTSMKIAGVLNTDDLTIDIDGEDKKLSVLLQEYNGSEVEINIKNKSEEELDEPTSKVNDRK